MFGPRLLGLGVASVVLTVWIDHHRDVVEHEGHQIHLGFRGLFYFPWLAVEIIKANLDVARIILSPKMNIQPHIFKTKATQHTETGRTTYANSITLTPGTVTLSTAEDGSFEIHVITDAARRDVESLVMDKRCSALEGLPKKAKGAVS